MTIKDYLKFTKIITNIEVIIYEMSKDNYRLKDSLSDEIQKLIEIKNTIEEE